MSSQEFERLDAMVEYEFDLSFALHDCQVLLDAEGDCVYCADKEPNFYPPGNLGPMGLALCLAMVVSSIPP